MNARVSILGVMTIIFSAISASAGIGAYGDFEGQDLNGEKCRIRVVQGLNKSSDRIGVIAGRNVFVMGSLSMLNVSESDGGLVMSRKMHVDEWYLDSTIYRPGFEEYLVKLDVRTRAEIPTGFKLQAFETATSTSKTIDCHNLKSVSPSRSLRDYRM